MKNWTSDPSVPKSAQTGDATPGNNAIQAPSIGLPKGGGALKSIDEKFEVNAVNGTASFSTPLPFSKTRGSFAPALSLNYNSGSGNSTFGLGWHLSLSSIQRRTDKWLPLYKDAFESDVFMFSGAEDLVPALIEGSGAPDVFTAPTGEQVKRYRPRIEGGFSRIEQITAPGNMAFYWKVTDRNNGATIYGRSPSARIADPADPARVFQWLPELSYDDKGNCLEFVYIPEDQRNVPERLSEANRLPGGTANTYLKRIHYGNKTPYYPDLTDPYSPAPPTNPGYFFEAVFDYGDHDGLNPTSAVQQDWPCRIDVFSNYKPGFEVRTYRLCQRVLFFHNFLELNDGIHPGSYLVRSVDIGYRYFNNPAATVGEKRNAEVDYVVSIRQTCYLRNNSGGYDQKSLPPVDFSYQELQWNTAVQNVSQDNLINDPGGLSTGYQWMDLWNEGISGILSEQAGGWYYKSNLGDGQFTPAQLVAPRPSFTGFADGALQLQDLDADGRKSIVQMSGPVKGYTEQYDDQQWAPFRAFDHFPTVDLGDPDTKFIDLTGDGKPDIIVSEENVFTWYASKGMRGYDAASRTAKPFDEEKGPALVFWDPLQTMFLADMTGDGLTDLVRIRNGEVCYWPNLGYGQFGAKVSMDNAPVFDYPDLFNPSYLHLADINGTGATDILYLGQDKCQVWLNQTGNGWSVPVIIDPFPATELPSTPAVIDFLGSGTVCIVWSSPLPAYGDRPLRYIDLMGGNKPFIMNGYANNLGKQTGWTYKSSTFFYLQDKAAGTPWITKLPFPVQCVCSMTVADLVTDVRFTHQYVYHHGYYDHPEREFRGFGMVEQTDTDTFDVATNPFDQAPVLTKTWFHTGAYIGEGRLLDLYAHEYFLNTVFAEHHLPASVLPTGMSAREAREAFRACKGMVLRQEIYGLDGSALTAIPYSAAEHNCQVQMLQPRDGNRYAVFLVTESEAISYYYERNAQDPRIAHSFNIAIDDLGNVLQSAAVVYPRQSPPVGLPAAVTAEQQKLHITYSVSQFTNDVLDPAHYRLRVLCEGQGFELTGLMPAAAYFALPELSDGFASAVAIPYEETANGTLQKKLIKQQRILFVADDTTTALPLGQLTSLGLVFRSYQKAFTATLLSSLFGARVPAPAIVDSLTEGKYALSNDLKASHLFPGTDEDNEWWVPSGTLQYGAGPVSRFYLPAGYVDPFGNVTTVEYYSNYFLLIDQTTDAVGNTTSVEAFDWRVLSAQQIKDINDNLAEASFDILGMTVGLALMGKGAEADDLLSFVPDLSDAALTAFFNDPVTNAPTLLQHATSRFIYDFSIVPVRVANIARETHYQVALANGTPSPLQLSFAYSDGLGNIAMKKVQADPGPAKTLDGGGNVIEVDTTPNLRWIGNGRTVLNNKGKPVKQYEPYFSTTFGYETDPQLVEIDVTPILFYDPIGRVIKTVFPDGTLSKTEFDAWQQVIYDQNDTVNDSDWYALRTTGSLAGNLLENQAAQKASVHYNTPLVSHTDSLGRVFYGIQHNRYIDISTDLLTDAFYATQTVMDIEGNHLAVIDARGNAVMTYGYGMTANMVHSHGMDTADRWMLPDCMGKTMHAWDSKDQEFHTTYDPLHRPLQNTVAKGAGTPSLFSKTIYGEGQATDKALNLRGQGYQLFDQAGVVVQIKFDFKGNPLQKSRQLCTDYREAIDWNSSPGLEAEVFNSGSGFDALSRPILLTLPDNSAIAPSYNKAGLLTTVQVGLKGSSTQTVFVKEIDYNEKGQRQSILYGNNTKTGYTYDPDTFRLVQLLTTGSNGTDLLQKLGYTFDPVGNITHVEDDAQQSVFFSNSVVSPSGDYTYDAIYQLIGASGREHIGQNIPPSPFDASRTNLPQPGDGAALRNYTEQYQYDPVGNILQMIHAAGMGSWTRVYTYGTTNNQLQKDVVGANTEAFSYDVHGNMLTVSSVQSLTWDFKDELQQADLGGGGTAYYVYDAGGQRTRKVIERLDGSKVQRIYLGGYEVYRQLSSGGTIQEETQTAHIMDDVRRIAMVETNTIVNGAATADQLIRYQYGNHLGSASLELDDHGATISYEEYYPYGCTSYQAMNALIKAAAKRYRYTGMERDDESGLEYHSARYYLPWLGRWLSADPDGIQHGDNLYQYVSGRPIVLEDPSGLNGDQLSFSELVQFAFEVIATPKGRGFKPSHYATARKLVAMWGGPEEYDLGHIDNPFSLTRAGERGRVQIQERHFNRSQGASTEATQVQAARNAGQFTRTDGVDMDALEAQARAGGRSVRNPPSAPNDFLEDPRFKAWEPVAAPSQPEAPVRAPKVDPAPWEQLELPFDKPPASSPPIPVASSGGVLEGVTGAVEVGSKALFVVALIFSGVNIATAPKGQRLPVAAHEAGSLGGGLAGGAAGSALLIFALGSNPGGWLVLGAGVVGGLVGGYLGSKGGGAGADYFYNKASKSLNDAAEAAPDVIRINTGTFSQHVQQTHPHMPPGVQSMLPN